MANSPRGQDSGPDCTPTIPAVGNSLFEYFALLLSQVPDSRPADVSYTFGVNEVGDRPAPIVGGWLRVLTALVMMPDYSVRPFISHKLTSPQISVLGFSGTEDLSSAISRPYSDSTLCGYVYTSTAAHTQVQRH